SRNKYSYLATIQDGLERCPQRHFSFPIANVTTHQAVHGARPLHICLNLFDGACLVWRLFVWETVFQFAQPRLFRIGRKSVTGYGFASTVESEKVACDILHILLDLGLGACPFRCTQLAECWNGIAHADITRDAIKLVGRNIELISTCIANQQ